MRIWSSALPCLELWGSQTEVGKAGGPRDPRASEKKGQDGKAHGPQKTVSKPSTLPYSDMSDPEMGWVPEPPTMTLGASRVELRVSCHGLLDRDTLAKPHPCVLLKLYSEEQWVEVREDEFFLNLLLG